MDKQWTPTINPTRVTIYYEAGTPKQWSYTRLALAWRVKHEAKDVLEYLLINGHVQPTSIGDRQEGTHVRVEQYIGGTWTHE